MVPEAPTLARYVRSTGDGNAEEQRKRRRYLVI
jgi:hypothetical protein